MYQEDVYNKLKIVVYFIGSTYGDICIHTCAFLSDIVCNQIVFDNQTIFQFK